MKRERNGGEGRKRVRPEREEERKGGEEEGEEKYSVVEKNACTMRRWCFLRDRHFLMAQAEFNLFRDLMGEGILQ